MLLILVSAAGLLVGGCADEQGSSSDGSGRSDRAAGVGDPADPGFGHVHGLGLDPADGAIYAATHYGVWRLPAPGGTDPSQPARVADRLQDTMGFTVAGPNLFYGSGHPDVREKAPPHLGFIVSRDRAETWEPVALRGEADFHDLAAVGARIYGYDATAGRLRVSDDTGRTWQEREPRAIRDVTVSPDDPDLVLATTEDGLVSSRDAGVAFEPVDDAPPLLLVDWVGGVLAGVDVAGTVWSATGGRPDSDWVRRGELTGAPQAFTVAPDGRLLAADELGVQLSADGGATWTLVAGYDGTGKN